MIDDENNYFILWYKKKKSKLGLLFKCVHFTHTNAQQDSQLINLDIFSPGFDSITLQEFSVKAFKIMCLKDQKGNERVGSGRQLSSRVDG